MPTGATRVAGVIGDPVHHSLSPAIHNAAFAECGLDWIFVAFPTPPGRGAAAVTAMRDLGIGGLSVTMPHKEAAASACDTVSEHARRLRSVNAVTLTADGVLEGDSTDGAGLVRALHEDGISVSSKSVLVIGTGGAGRAVALALREEGADVTLAGRRAEAVTEAAETAGVHALALAHLSEAARAAEVVVNATPIGMEGIEGTIPFDLEVLGPQHLVIDLVYQPALTPLLITARHRGATAVGGLGMLVHQAALAFRRWTGVEAPLETMRAAAVRELREPLER
ncbi:MAG TPA: shikimate dehydrogenase [Acidimicrobiia bacterium]|nr:shikimate dehydrogenase [Acidimicrobiia bacterium]